MDLNPYSGIIALGAVSAGFLLFMLLLARYLGPRNATKTKQLPFECGSVSIGDVREKRFKVRFYLVAVLFLLFDVEVVFMYPWAVNIKALGYPAFFAVLSFVVVLTVGLIYVWRKGVFNWNS